MFRTAFKSAITIAGFMFLGSSVLHADSVTTYATGLSSPRGLIFGPDRLGVATVDVPYLGPVPTPLVLLTGSLVLSILLGWLLNLHAGRVGRRMGREAAARVRESVAQAVELAGFGGLDRVENARRRLASLAEDQGE